MTTPAVSVLVPVFNREKFLPSCLDSALRQTFSDFEIVVVDNASTDSSWEICQSYARKDRRVRAFRNDANLGPVGNWMRCVELARGLIAKFLFSDDMISPGYLAATIPYLKEPDVGLVFTQAAIGTTQDAARTAYSWHSRSGKYPSADFVRASLKCDGRIPLSPGAALLRLSDVRKNLLRHVPLPDATDTGRTGAGPDVLLLMLTAIQYSRVGFVCEPLTFFRAHEGSITISQGRTVARCYELARCWFAREFLGGEAGLLHLSHVWIRETQLGRVKLPSTMLRSYSINGTSAQLVAIAGMEFLRKLRAHALHALGTTVIASNPK